MRQSLPVAPLKADIFSAGRMSKRGPTTDLGRRPRRMHTRPTIPSCRQAASRYWAWQCGCDPWSSRWKPMASQLIKIVVLDA
jgi:hypothetical protein